MKKIIITLSFAVSMVAVFAQSDTAKLVSKKGIPILPQAGDFAIGVDASPFLKYVGGFLSNAGGGNINDFTKQTLYAKYYLDATSAVRVCVMINKSNTTNKYYTRNDAAYAKDPLSKDQTQDWLNTNNNGYGLDIAYQKNRGYGRLRGIYGAQVGFSYSSTFTEYKYGNPLTTENQSPSSVIATSQFGNGARALSVEGGTVKAFGLGALAGVEYFFAPKICVGFELNLALVYRSTNQKFETYERVAGTSIEKNNHLISPGGDALTIVTNNPTSVGSEYNGTPATNAGGKLYLMFHF